MKSRPPVGSSIGGVAAVAFLVAIATRRVAGHVDYVTETEGGGGGVGFVGGVLSEPANLALVAGAGVLVAVATGAYLRFRPARRDVAVFRDAMADYRDLLPWLLRLSLGLPLVGAGFAGYVFSPSVTAGPAVLLASSRLFQVAVGFLLLFGLATRAAAAVGLLAYLLGVATAPDLLLASEYVPGFLAILLVGGGRPSADHVLHRVASAEGTVYGRFDPVHRVVDRFDRAVDPHTRWMPTIVRVGLGVTFASLGITQKLLSPTAALAVVEKYRLTAVVPVDPGLWVVGAGIAEVALGIALVLGLFARASSVVAISLFVLTLFGLPDDPVLAHVTLFGLASVVLITGAGPYALDGWLGERFDPRESATADAGIAGD